MTDLEKMLFIRAKILEGKTKKQATRELTKQIRLDGRKTTTIRHLPYAIPNHSGNSSFTLCMPFSI